ncbi:ABC transporter substrate-binding protein [Nocardia sp. NPDC057227]|uniref:ABC transporter substrate-binding protein n=1 Tax=Nocardia sp. NPDC057227 TaxID=3346056 RepID=UPI0036362196
MHAVRTPRVARRAVIAAVAGVLALGIAGCGSDSGSGGGDGSVTVTHALGETTVDGTPAKVVALGNQWLDTTLAFDVIPVGYVDNVAIASRTTPPWQPDKLGSAKSIASMAGIAEQVAALEPDLILADPFIADQATYDSLSKIAPTIPGLSKNSAAVWQDQVTALGKVLRREGDATAIIGGVQSKIDGIVAANPGLKGKTYASTWLGTPTQLMVLTDASDGSGQVFTALGLTIPKNLADQPATGGRLALSTERIDEVTADLLLAGYSPGYEEKFRQLPGYGALPAVRNNATVFLNTMEITAVNQPTVLSVPFILDKLNPALVAVGSR